MNYKEDAEVILPYLPAVPVDISSIKAVMINEVVADAPEDDFYSFDVESYYMRTTKLIFAKAGRKINGINDILNLGVYITSAVRIPKKEQAIKTNQIKSYAPLLLKELELLPALKVIMLMGDVAKKAVNIIAKSQTRKNAVPAESTYKLRHTEIS